MDRALVLRRVADKTLTALGECNVGWGDSIALLTSKSTRMGGSGNTGKERVSCNQRTYLIVGNDLDLSVLHDPDATVGSAKVDTDYWTLSTRGFLLRQSECARYSQEHDES